MCPPLPDVRASAQICSDDADAEDLARKIADCHGALFEGIQPAAEVRVARGGVADARATGGRSWKATSSGACENDTRQTTKNAVTEYRAGFQMWVAQAGLRRESGRRAAKYGASVDGGLGQCQAAAQETLLSHRDQALRVASWIFRLRQDCVVAGHFPFQGELALNPPDCRMEEQERF